MNVSEGRVDLGSLQPGIKMECGASCLLESQISTELLELGTGTPCSSFPYRTHSRQDWDPVNRYQYLSALVILIDGCIMSLEEGLGTNILIGNNVDDNPTFFNSPISRIYLTNFLSR